jgi:hypothetical protein
MLRDEDLRLDVGRASDGGNFLRLTHTPTGLSRSHPGPLRGLDQHALVQTWLGEIEAELKSKGQPQHIMPAYRRKNIRPRRHGA